MAYRNSNFIGDYYAGPSGLSQGLLSFGQALGQGLADRGAGIRQNRLDSEAESRRQQQDEWQKTQQQWQNEDRSRQEAMRAATGMLMPELAQTYGITMPEGVDAANVDPSLLSTAGALKMKRDESMAKRNEEIMRNLATSAILSKDPGAVQNFTARFGVSPETYADQGVLARAQEGQANRDMRRDIAAEQAALRRDLQASKSNLPAPAPGYIWGNAPDGSLIQIPVPGGPAAAKVEEKDTKESRQQATRERQVNILSEDIVRALRLADEEMAFGIPTVGVGSYFADLRGTKAHDLAKTLDSIKARVGFDALQEMRANSPTGGALGAVSEKENLLLQSQLGSLEQSQSKKAFRHNLQRLETTYLDIVHGPGNWEKFNSEIRLKTSAAKSEKKSLKYNPQTGGFE